MFWQVIIVLLIGAALVAIGAILGGAVAVAAQNSVKEKGSSDGEAS